MVYHDQSILKVLVNRGKRHICFSMNLDCNKMHLFPFLPLVSHFLAPSSGTANFHSIMTLLGFRVTGSKHRT